MRSWIQLALISLPISILVGCNFIQAVQKPIKLYEGQERSREELALLNFCVVIGRAYPGRVTVKIDGKDAMSERVTQASDRARYWGALSCRARILPGEHKVYYKASGSKWPGSAFKGVVDFKSGKTYYFIFKGCTFCWNKDRSSAWLEDEDGNVVAGTKLK
jgi:hypothetical protein